MLLKKVINLVTELCSNGVRYIVYPSQIGSPIRIVFSASVAVWVNTIFLSGAWNKFKSSSLVSDTIEAACAACLCWPLPTLTPNSR